MTEDYKIKIQYVPPAASNWEELTDVALKINTMGNDQLQKLGGLNKAGYDQFFDVISACKNFTDSRTGEVLGDITELSLNHVIVFDSLTGLTKHQRNLATGGKPLLTQPDYGVIMANLERFLDHCAYTIKCHMVLMSHVEPEKNEVTGDVEIMVSTIGRKLAPIIPNNWDDVIYAAREGTSFNWSTAKYGAATKARYLTVEEDLKPDWALVYEGWKNQHKDSKKAMGFRAILMGRPGSGKTYSVRTLLACGLTPVVIAMEPGYGIIDNI